MDATDLAEQLMDNEEMGKEIGHGGPDPDWDPPAKLPEPDEDGRYGVVEKGVCDPEYSYAVSHTVYDQFLYQVAHFVRVSSLVLYQSTPYWHPIGGTSTYFELGNVTVKCFESSSTEVVLLFESEEACKKLTSELSRLVKEEQEKKNKKVQAIKRKIYRWNSMNGRWELSSRFSDQSNFQLIGYEDVLDDIEDSIDTHLKHLDYLKKLGESKSLSFLLYGPPGVGKTTLIRTLASRKNYAVCIVNMFELNPSYLSYVLNPQISGVPAGDPRIVVFEDFDRFLGKKDVTADDHPMMSQILNALDGFEDKANSVRFFTGNNVDVILNTSALVNRMADKFEFSYPGREAFEAKLKYLFQDRWESLTDADYAKIKTFIDKVMEVKNLTLRPFTNYILRYMFKEDYLDQMLSHTDHLFVRKPKPKKKEAEASDKPKQVPVDPLLLDDDDWANISPSVDALLDPASQFASYTRPYMTRRPGGFRNSAAYRAANR